jgi:hypothetical protein
MSQTLPSSVHAGMAKITWTNSVSAIVDAEPTFGAGIGDKRIERI